MLASCTQTFYLLATFEPTCIDLSHMTDVVGNALDLFYKKVEIAQIYVRRSVIIVHSRWR